MTDSTAEKLQNMNLQDFDGSEFDPFSPQHDMDGNPKVGQSMDLLGNFSENGPITNGSENLVSFDNEVGFGLPNPTFLGQGQGQDLEPPSQRSEVMQRNMSEGEILGFQNEYGESTLGGQAEYVCDSDEEEADENDLINVEGTDIDQVVDSGEGQGDMEDYSSHKQYNSSQDPYDQYVENDYEGDVASGVQIVEDTEYDGNENDQVDPDNWHPEMDDPERVRRSMSPERSVSPYVGPGTVAEAESDMFSPPSEASHSEGIVGFSEASTIPVSQNVGTPELQSQSSQALSSETESLDSRSEAEGTPKKTKMRIPKPKTKKCKELPPWDDNVVIPPLPRMKPTLIGKKADLEPASPPPKFSRPKTAPARHTAKDASSDSGVEEEARVTRKSSADIKKKYGIDTKNERYKPGGGNVQVFSQKIDTKSVAPRTDTSKPKSAIMSPRISPSKEKSPSIPKTPAPNTKAAQSKIGSLNNVKHTPGGGNVKVLSTKVDVSNVQSKVGSKDKIDHKPKGGDKKIETRKLNWQTESKVGSLKNANYSPGGGNVKILDQKVEFKAQSKVGSTVNIKHKPGGGDKKIESQKLDFKDTAKPKVGSMDKVKHKPGGGDVKILDEKVDFSQTAKSKVGSMEKVKHQPGGGDKKIETQKLNFKETAKARTDTGASSGEKLSSRNHSRAGSVTSSQEGSAHQE